MGANVKIDASCRIWAPWNLTVEPEAAVSHQVDLYNIARIRIGAHATVSQYAFLCTGSHDIRDATMALTSRPIAVGDQAWVCARVFVGPGVTVGTGAVAAAQSVITRDLEPWSVWAGNPAQFVKSRQIAETPHSEHR